MTGHRTILLAVLMTLMAAPAQSGEAVSVPAAKEQSAISREPFYADIVARAGQLKSRTEALSRAPAPRQGPAFTAYAADIKALSDSDMQGHLDLKARGTDRDLKCILMGVSLDLPNKLKDIEAAKTDADLSLAFTEMRDLLDDNVLLITTPATTESGLDCVIEFGDR